MTGLRDSVLIDVDEKVDAELLRHIIAELGHLLEFPRRIDMEEGEGGLRGIEGLHREMKHDRRILADGIEHHRIGKGRRHLAEDMNRFSFQPLKMCQ
jgi:hypothetical protein